MPNCDFYAVPTDWLKIVDFILSNDGWILYEHSSEPDQEVRTFRSTDQVRALISPTREHYSFQLYSPAMGGKVSSRRITFTPGAVPGATFRYVTEGWGLIQVFLQQPNDGYLRNSHTNHFSEKGATRWTDVVQHGNHSPDMWDWKIVASVSRRLNRHIKSLGVATYGRRAVLEAAQHARQVDRVKFLPLGLDQTAR